jgi:cell division septal protein FtsQ
MHQRKSKKILIYFFLLLLVASINNTNLSKIKFEKIKDINVIGLAENDNIILFQKIKNLSLSNIFLIDKKELQNQINLNNLVENYSVFKKYPNSINIKIKKTKFLARINDDGQIYLVGSNGKLSKNNSLNNELPFIFGKPEISEFLNFKKIIDQSKISYDEIKSLSYFLSNRWDLELKNDKIIKLPKNHTNESLKLASKFLHNDEFRDIKIIDVRIKNQIILND